jgi:putative transcriptional regulator
MSAIHSITPGTWLIATTQLHDTYFEKSVIFIHECNARDVIGFMVNRPYQRQLQELVEFNYSKPIALFEGGPVDHEHLYVLHTHAAIADSTLITQHVHRGGNLHQLVQLANKGLIQPNAYRIFLGYCGWDTDQLQEELTEGSWQTVEAAAGLLFEHPVQDIWQQLHQLL